MLKHNQSRCRTVLLAAAACSLLAWSGRLSAQDNTSVRISAKVPAQAEVWIGSQKMTQTGAERQFVSPPIPKEGSQYYYDVRVRWMEGDQEVERTRRIYFQSGDHVTVRFRGKDEEVAAREPLPQPPTGTPAFPARPSGTAGVIGTGVSPAAAPANGQGVVGQNNTTVVPGTNVVPGVGIVPVPVGVGVPIVPGVTGVTPNAGIPGTTVPGTTGVFDPRNPNATGTGQTTGTGVIGVGQPPNTGIPAAPTTGTGLPTPPNTNNPGLTLPPNAAPTPTAPFTPGTATPGTIPGTVTPGTIPGTVAPTTTNPGTINTAPRTGAQSTGNPAATGTPAPVGTPAPATRP
jgi:uncharacterized protein (TIGR03000 family)